MTENPLPADFAADSAPQGTEPPIIRVSDVSFTYDGETLALSGASVRIARGEFVCVLGGNGSGKSTLAKHLNALLVPDKGRVEVCGMDTSARQHTYAIRQSAGMVFQNPDDQLVASLVEDDVAFGPENLGIPCANAWPNASKTSVFRASRNMRRMRFPAGRSNASPSPAPLR